MTHLPLYQRALIQLLRYRVSGKQKDDVNNALEHTCGCSDANFLCGMGLPTVLLATGMDKIHTTEECLAVEDLNNAARWVLGIVREATERKSS